MTIIPIRGWSTPTTDGPTNGIGPYPPISVMAQPFPLGGDPSGGIGNPQSNPTNPSPNPPHLNLTFDTIGQIIPRTIGHVRLALKPIWVQGLLGNDISQSIVNQGLVTLAADAGSGSTSVSVVNTPSWLDSAVGFVPLLTYYSGSGTVAQTSIISSSAGVIGLNDPLTVDLAAGTVLPVYTGGGPAATITAAFALCQPLDPNELGNVTAFFDGANQVYSLDQGGLTLPSSWTIVQQGQLQAALSGAVVYPGTEGQLPADLIIAERGADKTPAFRGLRYIIIQDYPLIGNGILSLSTVWRRSNPIVRQPQPSRPNRNSNVTAVTFGAGLS
jgi:hypothetical protein